MNSDITAYCNCMKEVRQRINLVNSVLAGLTTTGHEPFDIELIFLQLRKTLELIAFASLAANKVRYSAAYTDFTSHWNAKRMLENLEKINSNFYPVPLEPPVLQENNVRHFPRVAEAFLAKDEFIILYNISSKIIHRSNPFSAQDPVIQIHYSVEGWVSRIQRLLALHYAHLIDSNNVWIVNIPCEGEVCAYEASATS